MRVDSIINGIVIDHITGGKSLQIYKILSLDKLDCSIAILQNVHSQNMGKKDIIKINCILDLDFDMLGFISPSITINIIKDGKIIEKKHIELPETLTDILICKNPRCITQTEHYVKPTFILADRTKGIYKCEYCDEIVAF